MQNSDQKKLAYKRLLKIVGEVGPAYYVKPSISLIFTSLSFFSRTVLFTWYFKHM